MCWSKRLLCSVLVVAATGCGEGAPREITDVREQRARPALRPPSLPTAERLGVTTDPESAPLTDAALTWTAPAEWERAEDQQHREVTFRPKAAPGVECYVSILEGDAGGIPLNLDRWRDQVGLPALTDAERDALPRVTMLGQSLPWLDVRGTYVTMDGQRFEGHGLMAVACPLETRCVFVKMIGPGEFLGGERDRFLAFCRSLRRGR